MQLKVKMSTQHKPISLQEKAMLQQFNFQHSESCMLKKMLVRQSTDKPFLFNIHLRRLMGVKNHYFLKPWTMFICLLIQYNVSQRRALICYAQRTESYGPPPTWREQVDKQKNRGKEKKMAPILIKNCNQLAAGENLLLWKAIKQPLSNLCLTSILLAMPIWPKTT